MILLCAEKLKFSSAENRERQYTLLCIPPTPYSLRPHFGNHVFVCILRGFTWIKLCFSFNVEQQRNDPCSFSFIYAFTFGFAISTTTTTTTFIFRAGFFLSHSSHFSSHTRFMHHIFQHIFFFRERTQQWNGTLLKISITISISILNCIHIMLCLFH